ncbi:MAG: hypothetical protein ACMXYD_00300 [Candidatus Woesearchaeota archaeon]
MVTKKDRRRNGYVTPQQTIPTHQLTNYFITPTYSDWDDYRDGLRDSFGDNTLLKHTEHKELQGCDTRAKMNAKLQRLIQRRKQQQNHFRNAPSS